MSASLVAAPEAGAAVAVELPGTSHTAQACAHTAASVTDWGEPHVAAWLVSIKMAELQGCFAAAHVDGSALVCATDEDLASFGVDAVVARTRLLAEIKRISDRQTSSKLLRTSHTRDMSPLTSHSRCRAECGPAQHARRVEVR